MAGMAHVFDRGWLSVAQVLTIKPPPGGPARCPRTRQYQYSPPEPVSLSSELDWGDL
jgi:hypothetical protein